MVADFSISLKSLRTRSSVWRSSAMSRQPTMRTVSTVRCRHDQPGIHRIRRARLTEDEAVNGIKGVHRALVAELVETGIGVGDDVGKSWCDMYVVIQMLELHAFDSRHTHGDDSPAPSRPPLRRAMMRLLKC